MKNTKLRPFYFIGELSFKCSVALLILFSPVQATEAIPVEKIQYLTPSTGEITRENKADIRGVRGLRGVRGVRGIRGACMQIEENFTLRLLVPERTGKTLDAQPTLYWFVSQPLSNAEFIFILDKVPLTDNNEFSEPLIKTNLKLSVPAGIQVLPLAKVLPADKSTFQLEPGTEYRWTLLLTCHADYPSLDIKSTGTIKRIEPSTELSTEIQQSSPEKLPYLYAKQGLWYNALNELVKQIKEQSDNALSRKTLVDLLKQGGLVEVVNYDKLLGG
jgi:hypothetical protein